MAPHKDIGTQSGERTYTDVAAELLARAGRPMTFDWLAGAVQRAMAPRCPDFRRVLRSELRREKRGPTSRFVALPDGTWGLVAWHGDPADGESVAEAATEDATAEEDLKELSETPGHGSPEGRTPIGRFYRAVVIYLQSKHPKLVRVRSIKRHCQEALSFTPADRETLPSNEQVCRWERAVEWALNHLKRAGLVEPHAEKGYYGLTSAGQRLSPSEAAERAADVERQRLRASRHTTDDAGAEAEPASPQTTSMPALPLSELPIPTRLRNVLERLGATSSADVTAITPEQVAHEWFVGAKTVQEFRELLQRLPELVLPSADRVRLARERVGGASKTATPAGVQHPLRTPTAQPREANLPDGTEPNPSDGLSALETHAVRLRARGLSLGEIAQALGCSTKQIDNALQRARRKGLGIDRGGGAFRRTSGPGEPCYPATSVLARTSWELVTRTGTDALGAEPPPAETRIADLGLPPGAVAALSRISLSPDDPAEMLAYTTVGYLAVSGAMDAHREVLGALAGHAAVALADPDALITQAASSSLAGWFAEDPPPVPWAALGFGPDDCAALVRLVGANLADASTASERDILTRAPTLYDGLSTLLRFYQHTHPSNPALDQERADEWRTLQQGGIDALLTQLAEEAVTERNAAVWLRRLGVGTPDGEPATLDEIGTGIGLTRERVRQIAVKASGKIGKRLRRSVIGYAAEALTLAISRSLGICRLAWLAEEVGRELGTGGPWSERDVRVLLEVLGSGKWLKDGLLYHPGHCRGLLRDVRGLAAECARQYPDGRAIGDFAHDLMQIPWEPCEGKYCGGGDKPIPSCGRSSAGRPQLPATYVHAALAPIDPPVLEDSRAIAPDVWMLRHGTQRYAVVRAALRVYGKPVHYSELTQFIHEQSEERADIDETSVHACLTTYAEFVPVGRGVYALQDDGAQVDAPEPHVTTAQAIQRLLIERGHDMTLTAIIEALEPEGYRPLNIEMALQTNGTFVEVGHRVFDLAERARERPAVPPRRLRLLHSHPVMGNTAR